MIALLRRRRAMKIKAAVAFEAAKPLVIEELELGGRRRARCW
jgi:Zn-dependent alcohol dehydrogenase